MTSEQDALVESHVEWAKDMGRYYGKRCSVDPDELESAALFGLVKAALKFDPTKGHAFKTLVFAKVVGTIQDTIRADMISNGWHRAMPQRRMRQRAQRIPWPTHLTDDGGVIPWEPSDTPEYIWHLWLEEMISRISQPRERGIIRSLLNGYTKKDISDIYHVAPCRISQLTKRAMNQIHHTEENPL